MRQLKTTTRRNAAKRNAAKRQCPKCGRKSAMVWVPVEIDPAVAAYCRWEDCGFVRLRV